MEEILGNIYCWFESIFGLNLADHLWGFDGVDYTKSILYNTIGVISIVISLVMVLIYYYAINHPRFQKWWNWLLVLLLNSTINLFIGYAWCINDLNNGYISDTLCYLRDENGEVVEYLINAGDCWGFGIANFIVSAGFFIIFSFSLKWWSSNAKYSPF